MMDMMDKTVLFMAANGLDAKAFAALWECFGNLNASTRIASMRADEEIRDDAGTINTKSDMSFAEATDQSFDVVIIADGVTANAIKDDFAAKTVLIQAAERNAAIVAVGEGVSALAAADIINGLELAGPDSLNDMLSSAGARLSSDSVVASNNIFSARSDADLQSLCNLVAEYVTTKRQEEAA